MTIAGSVHGDDTILDTAAIEILAGSTATAVDANYSLTVSQTGDVMGGGGISDAYGTGSVDGWSANAYGTWFTNSGYLEWGAGYGDHDINASRTLAPGTDVREARK